MLNKHTLFCLSSFFQTFYVWLSETSDQHQFNGIVSNKPSPGHQVCLGWGPQSVLSDDYGSKIRISIKIVGQEEIIAAMEMGGVRSLGGSEWVYEHGPQGTSSYQPLLRVSPLTVCFPLTSTSDICLDYTPHAIYLPISINSALFVTVYHTGTSKN